MTTATATAIIYARQSFGSEVDSTSIAVQVESCKRWAQAHNITVIGTYTDANTSSELYPQCAEGIEAARIDRGYQRWQAAQRTQGRKVYKKGLGEAFDRIAQGGITHLLCYTRNRLGRTADGSYLDRFLTNYLLEHRVSLVTVQDGATLDFSDDFMALVMSLKDTLDYRGLREKAKASLDSIDRRINGYRKWSNAFGVVMEDGEVHFEQERAEAIRYAFGALVAGATYPAILKHLNSEYRHLLSGKQWYQSTLTNLLRNAVYAGYMRNREGVLDRAKNIPAPVITYTMWRQAQEVMAQKKTNAGKYNVAGERKHWLPLSGYLYCDCGRRMTMVVDKERIFYECKSPDHCRRIEVSKDVLATIQSICAIGALESRKRVAGLATASRRAGDLKARLERLQGAQRAKLALVETEDDVATYKPILDSLKAEIAEVKAALVEAEAVDASEAVALEAQMERDLHAILEGDLMDEENYQRVLQATVDRIVVTDTAATVHLRDGAEIAIPRIEGKWHARRLMRCAVVADADGEGVGDVCHYSLHLYDGDIPAGMAGGECVLERDGYSVWLHGLATRAVA